VLVAIIDSYLALVEKDPEVCRFVTRSPQIDVPREAGRDGAQAPILAHGLVGFVRESADHWVTDPDREPRALIVDRLAEFAAAGLCGLLENHEGEPL